MRILSMVISVAVIVVAFQFVMYLNTTNEVNVAEDSGSEPVVSDTPEDPAPDFASGMQPVPDQPSAEYLSEIYRDYLDALQNGSDEEVLEMFSGHFREAMLKQHDGDEHALAGFLRMNRLEPEFVVIGTQYATGDGVQYKAGQYAVLSIKGQSAIMLDKEVTATIYFYQEPGEWKLNGITNSMMEEMIGVEGR